MRFKDWLTQDDWLDHALLEGMLALHRLLVESYGEPITLEPSGRDFELRTPGRHLDPILPTAPGGGRRLVRGQDQNIVIPLDALERIQGMSNQALPRLLSHFVRDQPYIPAFAQSSPENLASAIIFVL